MTVSSEISRSGPYIGNGVTTVFDYEFKIFGETEISVIKTVDGVETILVIDADYVVSDVGNDEGGQVACTVAPSADATITLLRKVPFTQETVLENQGAYFAKTVENALDLAVMRDQELNERLDRAVVIPASSDASGLDSLIEDILRLGDSADNIDTVANDIANVNIVATNIDDVNTVAENIVDVTNFADVYQGPKAAAPTLRNDGSALHAGDLYFDTALGQMKAYTGSVWVGGSGDMFAATSAFDQALTRHFWGPDGARIHKMTDRVFIDAAARDFDETNNENGSYVALFGGSGYIDRCASFAAYSSRGGIGVAGASRTSDQYTSFPDQHPGVVPTPWLPSGAAVLGQRRAYQGRVYTVTVGGVFSTSPPVHQTPGGSAANGTATLQFIDYTYMTPAGGAFFAIQDSADTGTAAWAQYSEVVQKASAGGAPSFIAEWNAKNQSAINPINDPYNRFAACIGLGMAAGGDPNAGAPTNPSSCAHLIYKNGHTWNTGIVFDALGITGTDGVTGFGIAMKLARGHVVEWQYAGGNVGYDLVSTVDTATAKQTQSVDNTGTTWLNNNGVPLFKVAAIAGVVTGNLQTLAATGGGRPLLQANGSAANMDIEYAPKGTGKNYSTAFWAGNADGSFGAKIQIRAGSGASSMSFGWTGSAVTIYVDNTLVRTLAANT